MDVETPDPFMANQWYPLAALDPIAADRVHITQLLGERVGYARGADGALHAWRAAPSDRDRTPFRPEAAAAPLPAEAHYGFLWTTLGAPDRPLFAIPEWDEPDRVNIAAVTVAVRVSAQRGIENFLDLAHLPYVHEGILGERPHTEVKDYQVAVSEDGREIMAIECLFWQPMASTASTGGADVDYTYRVPHPTCSVLYKSSPSAPGRFDVVAIFMQPMTPESVRAHMMVGILDDTNTEDVIRAFQIHIFGQDKPILENQHPKRLPLDPRAETPIRADKSSIAYRRWLAGHGVTYGTIPVAA